MHDPILGSRASRRRWVPRAKLLLAGAAGAAGVALAVVVLASLLDSDAKRSPRSSHAAALRQCVALWNGPENAGPRAILNKAALVAPSAPATTPGQVSLARRVLALRYPGPPVEDVGVGERGVSASGGECMIAHPANVLFLYAKDAWHQVGYSPGLAFEGIPQRATRSPNGVITLRKPGGNPGIEPGRIALAP